MKKLLFICLAACNLHCMFSEDYYSELDAKAKRTELFYKIAKERLSTKKDLNAPVIPGDGTTLLSFFVSSNDAFLVESLLKNGAIPSEKELLSAAMYCNVESAKKLLKYGVDPDAIDETTCFRHTALHLICNSINDIFGRPRIEFAEILLSNESKSANPNLYDFGGCTPLNSLFNNLLASPDNDHFCQRKHLIHLLIFHGANLRANKHHPTLCPVALRAQGVYLNNQILFELAKYTEITYYWRQLLLCRKKGGWFYILPKDLLKVIADKTA